MEQRLSLILEKQAKGSGEGEGEGREAQRFSKIANSYQESMNSRFLAAWQVFSGAYIDLFSLH